MSEIGRASHEAGLRRDESHSQDERKCDLERELWESKAETAACIEFLSTEMGWEYFRADRLYFDDKDKKNCSLENARSIKNFLAEKQHGIKLLRELRQARRELTALRAIHKRLVEALDVCRKRMVDDGYHSDEVEMADDALAEARKLEGK